MRLTVPCCLFLFVLALAAHAPAAMAATATAATAAPLPPAAEAANADVAASVSHVVVRNGPGAWSRNAYWDEYTLQLKPLRAGLQLEHAVLIGWLSEPVEVSDYYAMLWQRSQEARHRYDQVGVLLTLDTPMVLTTLIGGGGYSGGAVLGASFRPGRAPPRGAEAQRVQTELERRMPELPHMLADEQSVSLFFPITPGPRRLRLQFRTPEGRSVLEVPLQDAFGRLHLSAKRPAGKARVRPLQ